MHCVPRGRLLWQPGAHAAVLAHFPFGLRGGVAEEEEGMPSVQLSHRRHSRTGRRRNGAGGGRGPHYKLS
jgi:hypothetical protein